MLEHSQDQQYGREQFCILGLKQKETPKHGVTGNPYGFGAHFDSGLSFHSYTQVRPWLRLLDAAIRIVLL